MSVMTRIARWRDARALPDRAWFDEPDALDQIHQRADTADDVATLTSWVEKGYAVVENVVPHDEIDAMLADVDRVFETAGPFPSVEVCDLEFDDTGRRETLRHEPLLERPLADRLAARERSTWRIHALIRDSDAAERVAASAELERIASMILGIDSKAAYSINFHRGSKQGLHEDTAVFHLGVPNLIVGAWIACEDIVDESGPLVYYPGSHRRPMFPEFDDYPNINCRTATADSAARYNQWVVSESEPFEEHRFLAKKGDVLFWHGGLIHGGAPIADPALTRRSYVVHFVPPGGDALHRVTATPRY